MSRRWRRREATFREEDFQFLREGKEERLKVSEGQRKLCTEGDAGSSAQRLGREFWRKKIVVG